MCLIPYLSRIEKGSLLVAKALRKMLVSSVFSPPTPREFMVNPSENISLSSILPDSNLIFVFPLPMHVILV